jgi:hypothetical protein
VYGNYGNVWHPVNSVELYIPWNDTWIDLPHLPDIKFDNDETDYKMSQTVIMTDDTNQIKLLGGQHMNWDTDFERVSSCVWRLIFSHNNHSYYWSNESDQPMGNT